MARNGLGCRLVSDIGTRRNLTFGEGRVWLNVDVNLLCLPRKAGKKLRKLKTPVDGQLGFVIEFKGRQNYSLGVTGFLFDFNLLVPRTPPFKRRRLSVAVHVSINRKACRHVFRFTEVARACWRVWEW